jgi:ABC-type polysaccharide/polyol phosphate export permease
VFYALDMIPADYKIICWLNPVSSFMIIFRSILYKGEFPGAIFIISSFVSSLTALYLGYLFFNKVSSKFFKRL